MNENPNLAEDAAPIRVHSRDSRADNTCFPVQDYDLAATLGSGQAFRWRPVGDAWEGIVSGHWVRLAQTPAGITLEVLGSSLAPAHAPRTTHHAAPLLRDYLQLDADLPAIVATFPNDEPMRASVAACRGLRLLRQEPWECLVSFICSSTKQIVQIQQIIGLLCERFGEPIPVGDDVRSLTLSSPSHPPGSEGAGLNERARISSLSPQRGEGRGEGCESLSSHERSAEKQGVNSEQGTSPDGPTPHPHSLSPLRGEGGPTPALGAAARGPRPYAFPTAARLAACSDAELRTCKMGFRAPYILAAAQAVTSGGLDLSRLHGLSTAEAREALMNLPGVGRKIADCVLLFAYGKQDAFPVDVWVRRALKELYFPRRRPSEERLVRFANTHFGPNAGYAQQYLFHYVRTKRVLVISH